MPETEKASNARQNIIDTTIRLISERGYAEVTTILIAQEANVSQGLVFHYFKDKETLILAVTQQKLREFAELLSKETSGEKNALKKIEKMALGYCQMAGDMGVLFEVILRQVKLFGLSRQQMIKLGISELADLLVETIQEGIEQGLIRKVNPNTVASCLFGALNFNSLQWLISEKSFSLRQATKEIVDVLVKGIQAT